MDRGAVHSKSAPAFAHGEAGGATVVVMSSNFLAPTSSELERDWGIVLNDEWATDVVGGDYAPIIRRFDPSA